MLVKTANFNGFAHESAKRCASCVRIISGKLVFRLGWLLKTFASVQAFWVRLAVTDPERQGTRHTSSMLFAGQSIKVLRADPVDPRQPCRQVRYAVQDWGGQ